MFFWSLFFGCFFAIYGVWLSFGPARLMAIAPESAAYSLALSSLVYFVALPLAQWTWKRLGFARALMIWATFATLAYGLPAFHPAMLVWMLPLGSMGAAASYGLAETYMIESLSADNRAHEFGHSRKWGSLGFLLAAGLGGLILDALGGIQHFEEVLFTVAVFFLGASVLLVLHEGRAAQTVKGELAKDALDLAELEPTVATDAGDLPETKTSLTSFNRVFLGLALLGIVFQRVAENQTTAWFGAYWISHGRGTTEAGLLNAWSVFSEFVAMGLTTGWLARIDLRWAMMWSCLISALRWAVTPFCGELWCAIPLQSVHALSFGVFYPASLIWIRSQWPTTFFNTRYVMEGGVRVFASGYYYLAAGTLIPLFGFVPVFEGCAVMALLGAVVWWLPGFGSSTKARIKDA